MNTTHPPSRPPLRAPFAFAQHQSFNINPDASTVTFTLDSGHDTTNGSFHVQKGTVDFDRATPALSGLIVVSAASGNTGNASRDKKMLADVLQVSKFADVTFVPQNYPAPSTPPATAPSRSPASSPSTARRTPSRSPCKCISTTTSSPPKPPSKSPTSSGASKTPAGSSSK